MDYSEESRSEYNPPLSSRYGSEEMLENFSEIKKISTWRRLWVYLAKAEKELGLNITDEQIDEMEANLYKISLQASATEESLSKSVMTHVHVFASQCPKAAPIINLGASSCYVVGNTDLIVIKDGLNILLPKLVRCIHSLSSFAEKYKDLPTLGFTHMQPAQLTTVGKRACMWISDLLFHLISIQTVRDDLRFCGVKGTTDNQDSFLTIFEGDYEKVKELDKLVTQMAGFEKSYAVIELTYIREIDCNVAQCIACLSTTVHKICTDIRLLASMKEIEEPFEETQIGSSAMAYKRNPMRSERCCSLTKLPMGYAIDAAVQQMKCTLYGRAYRHLIIAETFLSADIFLNTLQSVIDGLVVYTKEIERHIKQELPFMATENILMAMVKAGGDRQVCHEEIRILSHQAAKALKMRGEDNNLIDSIRKSNYFAPIHDQLDSLLDPITFVGTAVQQVTEFLEEDVYPAIAPYKDLLDVNAVLKV